MEIIRSTKNLELKKMLILYKKSRERKKQGLFIIEGEREIINALKAKYIIERIFLEEGVSFINNNINDALKNSRTSVIEKKTFKKISIRSGGEKIIAVTRSKSHELKALKLSKKSLIVVLEEPEKPGNIGALYRTAAAAKIDAIIISNPKTDFYNPNSIRSSLGDIFKIPTAVASNENVLSFLKKREFNILTTFIKLNAVRYDECDYQLPCALVIGSESEGLSNFWSKEAFENLVIPMAKTSNSLNLSVSAGILTYEAIRKNKKLDKNTIL